MTPSDGRDAELLAKAEACSVYNFDSVEFVECKHALWNDMLAALRTAALPSPVDNPSREEWAPSRDAILSLLDLVESDLSPLIDMTTRRRGILAYALRLAANPPDPDSMNDKRAKEDMTLAHNVREATIGEFAKKPLPYGWTQEHAVKAAWMIGTLAITPIDEWKSKDELYAQLSEFRILHSPPSPGERT